MTQPNVTINELDGALGVLPPSAGRLLAVVGVSSAGTPNLPAAFARVRDLQTAFGGGPLVEAAAHMIEGYGRPVLCVKAEAESEASVSAITSVRVGTSTCVVTADAASEPIDDYEPTLLIVKGGTIAEAGITYRLSLDGGRTFGAVTQLGTANSIDFPDSAGIALELGAGTLDAGDRFSARATAAQWDSTTLSAALAALQSTAVSWELVHIVGSIDGAAVDQLNTWMTAMAALGKYHAWIGNTRIPNAGETEAAYLTALSTSPGDKSSKFGSLYAGACKLVSSVSGRQYRRPVAFVTAAREASLSEEQDAADVNLPALSCSIRDRNGNPDEHDESLNPGLDDARFATLRTWGEGMAGVYVNRPRTFAPALSDFQLLAHRRVLNLAHDALRIFFLKRLNRPILVDRNTGYILDQEALEIEYGALAVLRATLLTKPKASGALFTLSRVDNLLSSKTLTGQARVIPLAYPEFVVLDVGFFNPALQLVAA